MRQPGLSQKDIFFARIGGFCTWLTRTPPFFAKASWVMIFRESILGGYRHASRFFQICENSCCAPAICGVQAVIVGCCIFLCMLTGSRVTWTYLLFSELQVYLYLTCICCFFAVGFLGHDFLEGLRPQHTPC